MKVIAAAIITLLVLSGCTAYKSQYIPFRPPEQYANHRVFSGVSVGCVAYPERGAAKKAFGFDIRRAGLLPVMLVLDNKSGETVEILAGQSFLIDANGSYWPVMSNAEAFERLEKSTQFAAFFGQGAGKGALIGATAGGLFATALGIVSGESIASFLGKGAAMGGAAGTITGGLHEGIGGERQHRISSDVREKGLEGKEIPDQYLAHGFLFFPGEAKTATELQLAWQESSTRKLRRLSFPLGTPR